MASVDPGGGSICCGGLFRADEEAALCWVSISSGGFEAGNTWSVGPAISVRRSVRYRGLLCLFLRCCGVRGRVNVRVEE